MNPIIVFVENGKVVMTPEEFKKHMSDAYYKGYSDATSITSTYSNTTPWWEKITLCNDTATATNARVKSDA